MRAELPIVLVLYLTIQEKISFKRFTFFLTASTTEMQPVKEM